MAFKMIQPMAASVKPDGYEADESGDIAESPDSHEGLEYVKEFVKNLDDTEFAYLQDCITERLEAKDKPEYKSPDKVKSTMDAEGYTRSKTGNEDGDDVYTSDED